MRSIAVALPTWHNSVHPLAELAFLPLLPTSMSHYLGCRLACWQRDTFTTDQWTETGESPLTSRPKLDVNYCLAMEASQKIDSESLASATDSGASPSQASVADSAASPSEASVADSAVSPSQASVAESAASTP
jgi:hypothetical protein